jgi:hypothetical protein
MLLSKIEPVDDKGLHRSCSMQGMPPEGYQPLPPNPPEENYCREIENQSDAGSVISPSLDNSEGALVMVENPIPQTTSCFGNPSQTNFSLFKIPWEHHR